ncbi:hypothetical protein LZ009_02630 [Ramlibacter sp. XY19]|uniref:hypothetical protein n=1 Tax=Ramlibacter paludis TaxID=2908000 RepID=UPI0023DBB669|nr:hypothetical protein [Ramlibacter paludis]MCG2591668.1 hypothetical protein [Ramlibacter paludis]
MTAAEYRIESSQPFAARFLAADGATQFAVSNRDLAVSLAAKGMTGRGEIRVVHVPTGEVVFRKPAPQRAEWSEEL